MSTINIPREPNDALLRPFIGCPSAELPEAWAAMVRVAEGQNARAGTAPAALLTKPARVGGGSFGVGVPEHYVIEAAQRLHAQEGERSAMTAEEFADEERKRRTLWELIHGPLAAASQAPAVPAVDALKELDSALSSEVYRACEDLPEGWSIRIDLENGYGGVVLIDPDGEENELPVDGLLSDAMRESIAAAQTATKGSQPCA